MTIIPDGQGPLQINGATGEVIRREHLVATGGSQDAIDREKLARLSPSDQFAEMQVIGARGAVEDQRRADSAEQEKINAAIRDPRYKSDPAFRTEVQRKVLAGEFSATPSQDKSAIYSAELQRTGKLSESSIARAATDFGLPASVVRQHVEAVRAQEHSVEAALEQAQGAAILEVTGSIAVSHQLAEWLKVHDPNALQEIQNAASFGRSPAVTRELVAKSFKATKHRKSKA